ncbi:uncharacterized protein LY89DRAFT_691564 [Mollisia scopiformis]|uniref:Uncharacterized protein n=1 Tax=Mollisia scopiformis TaxID=149040 RepID=A0A132B659_MOLSC|nr:uncharacterized protein LY89DRAFT_691564 [Mollisia scopiformis]KUJ07898.1 hypothetical protein LY89DRAFT_691564 [Mollisia scopiformis]
MMEYISDNWSPTTLSPITTFGLSPVVALPPVPTHNRGNTPIDHLQSCRLHDDAGLKICYGTLRRNKTSQCIKKAASFQPPMMPTCRLHQDQFKRAAYCKVPLACGIDCGRICQWIPHSFQRCAAHTNHAMPCYFLKIPLELRNRIYDLLLPNKTIPSSYGHTNRRTDNEKTHMSILRVNQQIHDETSRLLYSSNTFTIQVSEHGLRMCNSASEQQLPLPHYGNHGHALQDYQMQLMLLDQQNKRRLMMARNHIIPPQNTPYPHPAPANYSIPPYLPDALQAPTQLEPVWQAPLSPRYFNLIQRFRIEIVFFGKFVLNENDGTMNGQARLQRLYEFSDHLHRLVNRFRITGRRINCLEIEFEFGEAYNDPDEVFSVIELLLRPSRRLCDIGRACVDSITIFMSQAGSGGDYMLQLLDPGQRNENLSEFLQSWSRQLAASTPSLPPSPVFDGYWRLEVLLTKIKAHCNHVATQMNQDLNSGFQHFAELKQRARIAREDDDVTSFKEILETVISTWQRYLDWEKEFEMSTWKDVEGIWDVVADGELVV